MKDEIRALLEMYLRDVRLRLEHLASEANRATVDEAKQLGEIEERILASLKEDPRPRIFDFASRREVKPPPIEPSAWGDRTFNQFVTAAGADNVLSDGTKLADVILAPPDVSAPSQIAQFNGPIIDSYLERKGAIVGIGRWRFHTTEDGERMIVQQLRGAGGEELSELSMAAVTIKMAKVSGRVWPGSQYTILTTARHVPLRRPSPFNNILETLLGKEKEVLPPEVERLWSMVSAVKGGPYGVVNDESLRWAATRALDHCERTWPFAPSAGDGTRVKELLKKLLYEGWEMDPQDIREIPVYGRYVLSESTYHLAVTPPSISLVST